MSTPDSGWVLTPPATLPTLRRTFANSFGPAQAAASLREAGYDLGSSFLVALRAWVARNEPGTDLDALSADRFWSQLSEFFHDGGWGRIQFQPLHPGVGALDCLDWAEAEPDSGSPGPTCHLSVGIFSELLSQVAGGDVALLEAECRSRGDARCRFLVGSSSTLGTVFQALRSGATADEAVARLG